MAGMLTGVAKAAFEAGLALIEVNGGNGLLPAVPEKFAHGLSKLTGLDGCQRSYKWD